MCQWGRTRVLWVPVMAADSYTGAFRWALKRVDACIANIVDTLNSQGLYTRDSCCGHGRGYGRITLHDGREYAELVEHGQEGLEETIECEERIGESDAAHDRA